MRKPADGAGFSARGALALGFTATAILVLGILGWSVFSSISGAVIAAGRVAVENRNRVVEHIDGGTVGAVYVRDGDRVARGEVLLRFDDAELRSEEAMIAGQYAELAARRNRLEAEMRGADAIAWDRKAVAQAAKDPAVQDILAGQERLFRARAAARADEAAGLRERIGQARNEIAGLEAQAASLKEQGALIARELKAQTGLYEKGLTRLSRVLSLERAAKNLEGQSGTSTAAIARAQGKIAELEVQILQIDSRRIEKAAERVRDIGAQENQAKERLASVRERLGRMEVKAPVAGEVFGMTVFAPREVVRPGEPILRIVPRDAGLVVVARLNPIDVDQVYPGQKAMLRFSAFPARETPEFEGRVLRVSADAIRDQGTGLAWYQVELAVDRKAGDGALAPVGEIDQALLRQSRIPQQQDRVQRLELRLDRVADVLRGAGIGQQPLERRRRSMVALVHPGAIARLAGELERGLEEVHEQPRRGVEPGQRGHRFRALQAAVADHVAHHRAVLLFDEGLVVFTPGTAAREHDPGVAATPQHRTVRGRRTQTGRFGREEGAASRRDVRVQSCGFFGRGGPVDFKSQ